MPRNLDRRIETLFPLEDFTLKQQVVEILEIALADNMNARLLLSDGSYSRIMPEKDQPLRDSQAEFMARARSRL